MTKGPRLERIEKGSVLTDIKNTSVIDFEDISDEQMNAMIDGTLTEFDEGDLVDGTVVKIEHDEVLVDIGFKSEGVIPSRELSIRKDADPSDIVELGEKIEALVLQKEDKDGRLILSKKRAEYERAWIRVEEKFKAGEVVTGEVIEVVKGGLILDIGLRGFLPASLVDLRRVKDLDMYLGTEIEARVIEMDRNRNNVVLSRRVLLEEGRKNERAEILAKLSKACASRHRFLDRRLRRVRRPRRHRWPRAHLRAVLEPRQPSLRGRQGRRRGGGRGSGRRSAARAHLARPQADDGGSVGQARRELPGGHHRRRQGDEDRAVRRVHRAGPVHRGSGAHLRDGHAPHRHPGSGREGRRRGEGEGHGDQPERRRISLSMKPPRPTGLEIEVDESIQVEEKPAKKKAEKADAPAEEAAAPEAAE